MDYRKEVLRTAGEDSSDRQLLCAAIGLAGEVGEFMEHLKKHLFQGHDLPRDKMLSELGDVRWYLELALHSLGANIEDIERMNIEKLRKRYPEGFDPNASINRTE